MCDFHSVLGVALGDNNYELWHEPGNSHSNMAERLRNLPNRQPIIFEAEWDGVGELPPNNRLIRNFSERPEELVTRIRLHYVRLKQAITEGRHFDHYFGDTEKWSDVWNQAIHNGICIQLPTIFEGDLHIYEWSSAGASALATVGGNLRVYGTASLDAPGVSCST